ncbi:hypothetical protein N665_0035s0036 [Sinapis alba]|nr:hypothetical protein N665_0035s0036 [Sinapis alba]
MDEDGIASRSRFKTLMETPQCRQVSISVGSFLSTIHTDSKRKTKGKVVMVLVPKKTIRKHDKSSSSSSNSGSGHSNISKNESIKFS